MLRNKGSKGAQSDPKSKSGKIRRGGKEWAAPCKWQLVLEACFDGPLVLTDGWVAGPDYRWSEVQGEACDTDQ